MTHVWGASKAADRVWAEVSGLPPSKAATRVFVVFQAYVDESFDQGGVFVLGGYIAPAWAWSEFSREWDRMLESGWGTTRDDGRRHFKMAEMAAEEERMKRVEVFFRVIEKYAVGHLSSRVEVPNIERALSRFYVNGEPVVWPSIFRNPYHTTFRLMMDTIHLLRESMAWAIPLDEKIDFYFDHRAEKRAILEVWDRHVAARPQEAKRYYGATPQFKDDVDFLPLQAADFWAWWVRKWHTESPEKIRSPHFGRFGFGSDKMFLSIYVDADEEKLADTYRDILRMATWDKELTVEERK